MENKYGDNFIVIVEVDKIRLWENYNEEEEQNLLNGFKTIKS